VCPAILPRWIANNITLVLVTTEVHRTFVLGVTRRLSRLLLRRFLGGCLLTALFTQLPRPVILGNPVSDKRASRKPKGHKEEPGLLDPDPLGFLLALSRRGRRTRDGQLHLLELDISTYCHRRSRQVGCLAELSSKSV
jgi:hypothetical protein